MSRTRIAQFAASQPAPAPVPVPGSAPISPFETPNRDSALSAAGAIGALLSSPYSTDFDSDSDSESEFGSTPPGVHGPLTPVGQTRSPVARARAASVSVGKGYQDVEHRIKSVEGELEHADSYDLYRDPNHDSGRQVDMNQITFDYRPSPTPSPPRTTTQRAPPGLRSLQMPDSPIKGRQSHESGVVRPPTIVEFPEPSLQPQGHGLYAQPRPHPGMTRSASGPAVPTLSTPSLDHSAAHMGYPPRTPPRSNTLPDLHPAHMPHPGHPDRPQPRITTSPTALTPLSPPRSIILPPPASPISPMLMVPPLPAQAHISSLSPPLSPFAAPSHSRSSSNASESIRGFDAMTEKKAFFREGHEELMSPFSPRPRMRELQGRSGAAGGAGKVKSGMDFWKRFSVSVRLDEVEKSAAGSGQKNNSTWLAKAHETRGRIKKLIWFVLVLALLIVAGIVAYFVLRDKI